jgi:hypothetical protein
VTNYLLSNGSHPLVGEDIPGAVVDGDPGQHLGLGVRVSVVGIGTRLQLLEETLGFQWRSEWPNRGPTRFDGCLEMWRADDYRPDPNLLSTSK